MSEVCHTLYVMKASKGGKRYYADHEVSRHDFASCDPGMRRDELLENFAPQDVNLVCSQLSESLLVLNFLVSYIETVVLNIILCLL